MTESDRTWDTPKAANRIRVAVGSRNPVKVQAAKVGFEQSFGLDRDPSAGTVEVLGCDVDSGVSDQPMSDEETRRGAVNRARAVASTCSTECDYSVGIEGGIITIDDQFFAAAWIAILDSAGELALGRSGTFALPPKVKELVESGLELGHANDAVFQEVNSKHAGGAVGSLTAGVIGRQALYEHAMILTLVRFRQQDLFCQ